MDFPTNVKKEPKNNVSYMMGENELMVGIHYISMRINEYKQRIELAVEEPAKELYESLLEQYQYIKDEYDSQSL